MKQRYMVVDVSLCFDCNNCFMACKDEHVDNDWSPYTLAQPRHGHRWMNIHRKERGQYPRIDVCYLSMPCQHCQDAPCMKANSDCISKREDGVVMIDPVKSKGKKGVVESCPYGAIYWNDEANVPQKCTMCAHLLDDGWDMPRCVHTCPTGALSFYTLEKAEMDKKVAAEKLEHYHPEFKSNPNVYYKNLYRFEKFFITGGVVSGGDCVENATVTLKDSKGKTCSQKTNYFGEFKFDGLEAGDYSVNVEAGGKKKTCSVSVNEAKNIGFVEL